MGWGCFFLRAEALGAEQPVEADAASGNGTKEMVWNAQARDEGGRDGIAGT